MNAPNDPIEVQYNSVASRFEVQLGDGKFAQIAYQMEGDVMIFVHTEVPKEFGGRGIADKMAYAALEYAKAHDLQVMALCPFVKAYIGRHPEYQPITIEYPG